MKEADFKKRTLIFRLARRLKQKNIRLQKWINYIDFDFIPEFIQGFQFGLKGKI